MRVISGEFKKHRLDAPKGHRTHPMGDRIKTALFNTIFDEVVGARVLDAYGGSGALAIEAISRGAAFAQITEMDYRAYQVIKNNLENLNIDDDRIKLTRANCSSWSDQNIELEFDIIFIDPPFDQLNLSTVKKLVHHLSANGLMVLSHTGREAVPTVNGVVVVDDRMYGDAALSYYRKDSSY